MVTRTLTSLLAILTLGSPSMAQDSGGVRLAAGVNGGPVGLARPLPFTRPPLMTAHDMQGGLTPADHTAQNQAAITRMRGDPGYLTGFAAGTPLAASRQGPGPLVDQTEFDRHRHRGGSNPIIINNQGPLALTVGNGNIVQQQSATGSGPIAQQQVATTPGAGTSGGGATNLVTAGGNIVQRAPGGH